MLTFILEQTFGKMKNPKVPLDGRVVIVTGSNTGLGLQAAVHLARLAPARIILAVRTVSKGETARSTVLSAVPEYEGVIDVWQLDQSSFASVKAFAKKAEAELDRLDILLANSGVMKPEWTVTEDGYEEQLQVNGIATGLLAALLLPLLKKTAALPAPDPKSAGLKPHLTIVGSEAHFWATFPQHKSSAPIIPSLNTKPTGTYDAQERYMVTKLINIHLAHGFASVTRDDIVVNVVNPGLCASDFARHAEGFIKSVMAFAHRYIARTTEEGSKNLVWAAVEDTSATPGAYVSVTSVKPSSGFSRSVKGIELEKRVWSELVDLFIRIAPETETSLRL